MTYMVPILQTLLPVQPRGLIGSVLSSYQGTREMKEKLEHDFCHIFQGIGGNV